MLVILPRMKTWGPEIWEEKSKHHDDVGVILGTGFNTKSLEKNTQRTLSVLDALGFTKDLPRDATILDVGVGPSARFSLELAKRGYRLTGIDGSEEALKRAREKSGGKVQLIQGDIFSFTTPETFDALFCVETFFHLPAHLSLSAFQSFHRALKPKGRALVQFAVLNEMTPTYLFKQLTYMSAYKLLKPIRTALGKQSFYVTVARHSDQEIRDIAERTGFRVLNADDGYYLFEKV